MTLMILVVVVLVALAIGFVMMIRREPPPVAAVAVREDDDIEGIVSGPEPIGNGASATRRTITWTQQFEPRSGSLSDEARLKLINDLGLLRAPWCVPLLAQAYEEETDPAHRVAVQLALARCSDEEPVPGRIGK
jgi:hypothetical protein